MKAALIEDPHPPANRARCAQISFKGYTPPDCRSPSVKRLGMQPQQGLRSLSHGRLWMLEGVQCPIAQADPRR